MLKTNRKIILLSIVLFFFLFNTNLYSLVLQSKKQNIYDVKNPTNNSSNNNKFKYPIDSPLEYFIEFPENSRNEKKEELQSSETNNLNNYEFNDNELNDSEIVSEEDFINDNSSDDSLFSDFQETFWKNQGEIAIESRLFKNDHNSFSEDSGLSVFSRLETRYEKDSLKLVLRGFARIDQKDQDRDFLALEDAYVQLTFNLNKELKLSFGSKLFNWSTTEAFHPADVINSRNFDSDIEQLEKKGELFLSISTKIFDTYTSLYYFPHYESPEYPGKFSRAGYGYKLEKPVWVEGNSKEDIKQNPWGYQAGIEISKNIADSDFSFHIIYHMDRDRPIIESRINLSPLGATYRLIPHYFKVLQYGFTYQKVFNTFVLKCESAFRNYIEDDFEIQTVSGLKKQKDHGLTALGFEFPFAYENGQETFIFWETQYLWGTDGKKREELNVFQNDMMLGFRHAINDMMGKEIYGSLIFDMERHKELVYALKYTQRLSDIWKIKMGFRIYDAPEEPGSPVLGLQSLHEDNFIYFNLIRYF